MALAVHGCANGAGAFDATPPPKATIVVTDGAYKPSRVRIPVGGRVTFVGGSIEPNTAETAGVPFFALDRRKLDRQGKFDLHTIQLGEAESVRLTRPGTYDFHSSFNGSMRGTIEVYDPGDRSGDGGPSPAGPSPAARVHGP